MPLRIKAVLMAKGIQTGTSEVYLLKWPASVSLKCLNQRVQIYSVLVLFGVFALLLLSKKGRPTPCFPSPPPSGHPSPINMNLFWASLYLASAQWKTKHHTGEAAEKQWITAEMEVTPRRCRPAEQPQGGAVSSVCPTLASAWVKTLFL